MTETVEPRDIVDALERAVDALMVWQTEWHAPILQNLADAPQKQAESLRHLDAFDAWFQAHAEHSLVNQPSMQRLRETLSSIRHRAARLSDPGIRRIPGEYEALGADVRSFVSQTRRLGRAFSTASSELDNLTGIQNRTAMHRALETEQARHQRTGAPVSVALVDLDHFKAVNDTYGHSAGDQVLRAAAGRLAGAIRTYDQVFRYGGEEFLVLLPNTELETARTAMDRLRTALSDAPIHVDDNTDISVTASFGVAQLTDEEAIEDVLERADAALYRAKESGRNRVEAG